MDSHYLCVGKSTLTVMAAERRADVLSVNSPSQSKRELWVEGGFIYSVECSG